MRYKISTRKCATGKQVIAFRLAALLISFSLFPQNLFADNLNDCVMEALKNADDTVTVGQLRERCKQKVDPRSMAPAFPEKDIASDVEKRMKQDRINILQPFTLMSHKPNYILPVAYNSSGYDSTAYQQQFNDPSITADDAEAQFQISVKFPLMINLYDNNIDLYAAYTNHSFWQVYNDDNSAAFRETNHEPEGWLQFRPDWNIFGFTNSVNALGFVHQSNGRSGVLSRSWNRVYGNFVFERSNFVFSLKPWYRLPEDDEDDDNPDITDYLGHYELRAVYKLNDHVLQIMSRNNLESGFENGAVELSWSFPLWDYPYLKGYVQYFSGYGESLIDYDNYVNKVGIGFAVTDWL